MPREDAQSKARRKTLRRLERLVYQRALEAELTKIETEFARWRKGEVDAFELTDLIHVFHQGPARKLWSRYDGRLPELSVVEGLALNLLREEDVDPELLALLADRVASYRRDLAEAASSASEEDDENEGEGE